jgi:hypothetical protein
MAAGGGGSAQAPGVGLLVPLELLLLLLLLLLLGCPANIFCELVRGVRFSRSPPCLSFSS